MLDLGNHQWSLKRQLNLEQAFLLKRKYFLSAGRHGHQHQGSDVQVGDVLVVSQGRKSCLTAKWFQD